MCIRSIERDQLEYRTHYVIMITMFTDEVIGRKMMVIDMIIMITKL